MAGEAFIASLMFEEAVRKALLTDVEHPTEPLQRSYFLQVSAKAPLLWALQQLEHFPYLASQNSYAFERVVVRLPQGQGLHRLQPAAFVQLSHLHQLSLLAHATCRHAAQLLTIHSDVKMLTVTSQYTTCLTIHLPNCLTTAQDMHKLTLLHDNTAASKLISKGAETQSHVGAMHCRQSRFDANSQPFVI